MKCWLFCRTYNVTLERVSWSSSLSPRKGEAPERRMKVRTPSDQISVSLEMSSYCTTSGATNSGVPTIALTVSWQTLSDVLHYTTSIPPAGALVRYRSQWFLCPFHLFPSRRCFLARIVQFGNTNTFFGPSTTFISRWTICLQWMYCSALQTWEM